MTRRLLQLLLEEEEDDDIFLYYFHGKRRRQGTSTSERCCSTFSAIKRAKKRSKSRVSSATDTDSADGSRTQDEFDKRLRDDSDFRESSHQTSQAKETGKESSQLQGSCYCSGCRNVITGFRYICAQCAGVELCGACEAAGLHGEHYVLRVPGRRPSDEVSSVLEKIREELLKHESTMESVKIEIKEEPDPLAVVEEVYTDTFESTHNQLMNVEIQVPSTETATEDTESQTASAILNKIRLRNNDFLNFKDTSFHFTDHPGPTEPKTNVFFDGGPHVKDEFNVNEESRCEVFVHEGVNLPSSELRAIAPASKLSDPGMAAVNNFITAPGTSNVTIIGARRLESIGTPATIAPQTPQRRAAPDTPLSRPSVTENRYFVEVTGTDIVGQDEDNLLEDP